MDRSKNGKEKQKESKKRQLKLLKNRSTQTPSFSWRPEFNDDPR